MVNPIPWPSAWNVGCLIKHLSESTHCSCRQLEGQCSWSQCELFINGQWQTREFRLSSNQPAKGGQPPHSSRNGTSFQMSNSKVFHDTTTISCCNKSHFFHGHPLVAKHGNGQSRLFADDFRLSRPPLIIWLAVFQLAIYFIFDVPMEIPRYHWPPPGIMMYFPSLIMILDYCLLFYTIVSHSPWIFLAYWLRTMDSLLLTSIDHTINLRQSAGSCQLAPSSNSSWYIMVLVLGSDHSWLNWPVVTSTSIDYTISHWFYSPWWGPWAWCSQRLRLQSHGMNNPRGGSHVFFRKPLVVKWSIKMPYAK